MLLQYKIYFIGFLYFFGILFMTLFPPRNIELSGPNIREARRTIWDINYMDYIDYSMLVNVTKLIGLEDLELATIVHLTPKTYKNKSIIALELHSDKLSRKPGILIIAGIDGMAWAAPNAVIKLANKLLHDTTYQTPFFNDYDWYLIPMANPDAFEFTKALSGLPEVEANVWSHNVTVRRRARPSHWHKNIDVESDQNKCFGTNINRNFAYHWQDDVLREPDQCSQQYPGLRPFSTAEADAIRQYIDKLDNSVHFVVHLHASFEAKKEYILYPWRYTTRAPSSHRSLQAIGESAARQARLPDGRLYRVHQASADGRVAGTLSDYIAGVLGIPLVFIVKPYYPPFANLTDDTILEAYVNKSISAIISLVRGWRSSTKQNTLSFFGRDIEF
ncbi:carboxypeptidase B-like [Aricia agestis]|uniref:carboxypeptidase B-like n=1 Tax=Aricia agestis TaxID=91739 RepID=UPI001C204595|nr:carboxypeptidase B-like [Aricia agestis]